MKYERIEAASRMLDMCGVKRDVYFTGQWKVDVSCPINARNEASALSLLLRKIQFGSDSALDMRRYGRCLDFCSGLNFLMLS